MSRDVKINLFRVSKLTFQLISFQAKRKCKNCSPTSFSEFSSCRIVIDCTDIEIAVPHLVSQQNASYSSYRGVNSFKVIVGVAPKGVIPM